MIKHPQAEKRVTARFWIHPTCYVVAVSALAALNLQQNPDHLWFIGVAGGWGIGIAPN